MQILRKAPASFVWCAGLSNKTNHLLFDMMTNHLSWASHRMFYIFKYILLSGLREKSLAGIFSHRIFASRAGRRPLLVVCVSGWRHAATARLSEDKVAGGSRFCHHHGSESYRWMTKTYSRMSGSEDRGG